MATTLKSMTTLPSLSELLGHVSPRPWKPDLIQTSGLKFLIEHACAGLLWGPGSGKTSATLAAFKFLKSRGMANKMLVVTLVRPAYQVWPKELHKWTDFHGLKMQVLHGQDRELNLQADADIYVTN